MSSALRAAFVRFTDIWIRQTAPPEFFFEFTTAIPVMETFESFIFMWRFLRGQDGRDVVDGWRSRQNNSAS